MNTDDTYIPTAVRTY